MPLPRNGTEWPPQDHTLGLQHMDEWSAWYSGDPDQLSRYYGGGVAQTGIVRPAQFSRGMVGSLARWWWGTPTADGEQRSKLHVPLAADIAGTSADLLFSESVKLTGGNDKLQETLDSLQDLGLDAQLHEAAEVQAALGGVYLRTVWDRDVSPLPWTDAVQPDGALPEFRNGRTVAVTLWTQLGEAEAGTVHRLLERHESGRITYGLYAGTLTNLGREVPLAEHPQSADLAGIVDSESGQDTGTKRLTVTYIPNMLPNRAARRSHLGRSDFQGVTPLFDALDEAYSSWWRDIRHAKSRIHVPAQYLDSQGPGKGAVADVDREVYVPLDGVLAKGSDGLLLDAQQFAIRYNEHANTCRDWANRAVQAAGYAVSTFGEQDGTAMTAAEVQQRERRSYMTRGKKVRYWTMGLRDHLQTMVEVANANLSAGIPAGDLGVEFGRGVQDSPLSLANTVQALRNAESASIATRVRMLHPDWDADAVDAEVALIASETGTGAPVPDPGAGF